MKDDKTVYDGGATIPDATVYEGGGTASDATVYDGGTPGGASADPFRKGGLLLDTYRIDSDPIHGGMGSVWRVRHLGWNVDLAMKRPQAEAFRSEDQKEGFIRECESWINLGLHPNIVSCYYVRQIEGVPAIFSEWMENGSLENRIRDGSVYEGPAEEVQERLLDIAIQFARGLHYAHGAGLIHQDVKPDNLLLTRDWEARVADFGLARARAQLTVLEDPGQDAGDPGATCMAPTGGYTPAYCSMEQMDGKALTRRTDIYSWAVSVMELYLGDRPWTSGVVAGLNCQEYLSQTRVPMPKELQALLTRCMSPDPEARPRHFGWIEAELRVIYRMKNGADYPRPVPKAAADTAASLNNRALSYLDLGRTEEAEDLWARALRRDATDFYARYNYELLRWNQGRISDLQFHNAVFRLPVNCAAAALARARISLCQRKDMGEAAECLQALEGWTVAPSQREELDRSMETWKRIERTMPALPWDNFSIVPAEESEKAIAAFLPADGFSRDFPRLKAQMGTPFRILETETGRILREMDVLTAYNTGDEASEWLQGYTPEGGALLFAEFLFRRGIALPDPDLPFPFELAVVEDYRRRQEAEEAAEKNYAAAKEAWDEGRFSDAARVLEGSLKSSVLLLHEPSMELWTELGRHFPRKDLVAAAVTQAQAPSLPAQEPDPERVCQKQGNIFSGWACISCDGITELTLDCSRLVARENLNCNTDAEFTYRVTAADVATGQEVFRIDPFFYTEEDDDTGDFSRYQIRMDEPGKLTLWSQYENPKTADILDIRSSFWRAVVRFALPGGVGLVLRPEGVEIGGVLYPDRLREYRPLFDADIIPCQAHNYRLIYSYDLPREEEPETARPPGNAAEGGDAAPDAAVFGGGTVPDGTVYEDAAVFDSGTVPGGTVYEGGTVCDETSPGEDPDAPFRRNEVLLDTYRIDSDPIHGGMGSVWRVRHQGWNVDLAMKRPQAGAFQTEHQKEGFVRECESWINLGLHPNIVSCYYVREIEGVPTIFSEWMENGSLENRIRDGRVYEGTAEEVQERLLDIAIQFARGLHYAHEVGLIHQDVKPDNLLLSDSWEAKVADFGLAQARAILTVSDVPGPGSGDPGATRMAPSGGYTPAYCSMEQMDGKALTRRTDIYSWAVSVMELYLGDRPWTNGVVAGLSCRDYFPESRIPMPEALQDLLGACMAPEPEARPHDFAGIEADLHRIYQTQTGGAYPRPAPKAAADTADSLNNRALSYLDLGRTAEAEALWNAALQQNVKHTESLYNERLYRWRKGEIDDLAVLDALHPCREDPAYERLISRIELERGDPDGVLSGAEEDVRLAAGSLPPASVRKQKAPLEHNFLEVSPDGSLVLFGGASATLYSAAEDRVLWKSPRMQLRSCCCVDWDAGEICCPTVTLRPKSDSRGRRSFFDDHVHHLYVYDLKTGTLNRKLPKKKPPVNTDKVPACRYLPDGRLVMAVAQGRNGSNRSYALDCVRVMDTQTGEILQESTAVRDLLGEEHHYDVLFREDCTLAVLVYGEENTRIFLFSPESWTAERSVTVEGTLKGGRFCFSPDGEGLWYLGDSDHRELSLISLQTGERLLTRPVQAPAGGHIAAYRDGTLLAAHCNDRLQLLDTRTGRVLRSFVLPGREPVAFGPDLLAAVGSNHVSKHELNVIRLPQFGYRAGWEVCRIRSTSHRAAQDSYFEKELSAANEAYQAGQYRQAMLHLQQARSADGRQNDPDALELQRKIGSHGKKAALRGAFLMQTVPLREKDLLFSEDGRWLRIRKRDDEQLLDVVSGQLRPVPDEAGPEADGSLREMLHRLELKRRWSASKPEDDSIKYRSNITFSRDWKHVAVLDTMESSAVLHVYDTATGEEEYAAELAEHFSILCLTEKSIVTIRHVRPTWMSSPEDRDRHELSLTVYDLESKDAPRTLHVPVGNSIDHISAMDCSPDGSRALVSLVRSTSEFKEAFQYAKIDLTTGKRSPALRRQPAKLEGGKKSNLLSYTGIGEQIVYVKDPSTVVLTPLRKGDPELEIREDFQCPDAIAVSPDGERLAVVGDYYTERTYVYQLEWEYELNDREPPEEAAPPRRSRGRSKSGQDAAESGGPVPGAAPAMPAPGRIPPEEGTAGETVPDAAVYEGIATIPDAAGGESGGTVPDRTVYDGGMNPHGTPAPGRTAEAGSFHKGDILLDTYRIDSVPIRGGMGSVWRVRHQGWNVDLAMKRPQAEAFQTEHQKESFSRECESWINLGLHPNIVSCYYVREIEGVPTIFSEWMENGSLENRIRDGRVYEGTEDETQERLLDIAIQFARGLHYAHEAGLIHQDVKPDNLLLSDRWEAKVADFGLAQARAVLTVLDGVSTVADADPGATRMAPSGGYTPAYCSMEQMDGKPLTRRTDVYSWAVSVMELYIGDRLWTNGVVAGLSCRDYLEQTRVPIPEALKALLTSCMAPDPEMRPHDFAEVEAELHKIYETQTGRPYPRTSPKAAADTADSLNNRALSYLDLGRTDEAEVLWERALQLDPNHVDARFNRELHLLREGRKRDYQVIRELERLDVTRQARVTEEIIAECGERQALLPPDAPWNTTSGWPISMLLEEGELYLGAFQKGDGGPCIKRIERDSGKTLETDEMEAVRSLDKPVKTIRIQAGGNRAVLTMKDGSVCLYDLPEKRVLQVCELPSRGDSPMPELEYVLHPDGSMVAFYDKQKRRTILLAADTLGVLADLDMVFVTMLEEGGCLLRGKVSKQKEALFLAKKDGSLQEVFRFARVLESSRESADPSAPFLCYQYKRTGECFYLDETYQPHPICEQLYQDVPSIQDRVSLLIHDPVNGLVYASCREAPDRIAVWDLNTQKCRFTMQGIPALNGAIWHTVYDRRKRSLTLWDRQQQYGDTVWGESLPLPLPRPARPARWRLSRIATVDERLREEDRVSELARQFESSFRQGEYSRALHLFQQGCGIPDFFSTSAADRMGRALDHVAEKTVLLSVRRLGELEKVPGYSYRSSKWEQISPCSGGLIAVDASRRHRGKTDVRLYREDGSFLRKIELPDFVEHTAVRGDRIYAFTAMLDCAVYDLEGTKTDALQEGWPPERGEELPDKRIRIGNGRHGRMVSKENCYPLFCDVDTAGEHLLYGIVEEIDPYGNRWEPGLYQRDLRTGETIQLSKEVPERFLEPFYLSDGSILSPTPELARHSAEDWKTLQVYPFEGFQSNARVSDVIQNPDRNSFTVKVSAYRGPSCWVAFDAGGEKLSQWGASLADIIPVPGGRFAFCPENGGFTVQDIMEDRTVHKEPMEDYHSICLRPDGRELYAEAMEKDGGRVTVFRLDYGYKLREADAGDPLISAPEVSDGAPIQEEAASNPESMSLDGRTDRSDPVDAVRPGEVLLDTYRVDSAPIRGGMGSVWRVRHQGWNVDLAMKRPQAEAFQTEHQKESFSRECESWINLGLHPNIVSCYYVREIEGVPTIFSEWMENGSLENRIRDGRVYEGTEDETQERLLDIAIQFARGLHYAHEAGLIHQDVKPDNLLLSDRWEAKVADFGLAQARAILTVPDEIRTDADADPGATRMAPSGGYTPAYCSMEQMDGRPLTRRTDVYSWAVSVMELYIGDRPWTNGVVAGLNCRDYFPESRIPMPEALQDLLAACMAPDPKDRPHDFAGIEADLHKIYQTQTGEAYPRPAPEAAADTADSLNNRALSYLDLGAPDQAEACWTRALEADGHHVDSIFNRALSRLRRGKSDLFDVERLLGAIPDQAKQEELYALIEREDECDVLLPEKATGVPSVLQVQGHSGNGQRFWGHIAGKTPRYAVYDTEKKRLIFSIPETRSDGFHVGGLSLSRDGRYAALNIWMETPEGGREEATAVWSMEDSTAVRSFDFPGGRLSPDGSCLVCSRYVASFNRHGFETDREYALDCYNTQTGELLSHREDCALLGFTWDGKLVVCTMGERVVFGGTPADPVPAEGAVLVRDDLRRDNREDVFRQVTEDLAVLSLDRAFLVCNIRTGEALCELRHAGEDFDYISEEDRFLATEDGQFFLRLNEHSRQISMWRDETEYPYTVTAHVWDTRTWREFFHSFLFNQTFHTKEERDRYIRQINLAGRLRTVLAHPETLHCQPRPQAEYRVSFAQSTAARLEAQETFRSRLREAEDAYASGNTARALRLADEAMAVPGFEAAAEALRLRAKYGAGLEKTGVRRIVPLKETAPAPRNPHAPPDKETLTRCDPILEQLKADILNRWKGRDVYSEYKVRAMVGNGASRDGRFRLLHTLILEERDSPAQNDIEYTDFHGAAVLDTRTWQIVWQQDDLSSSSGNGTPTIFKRGHMTMIDHSGARLLVQAGHSGLTLIPIDRDTEPIALMKNTKFRYADFLDDDRFVLAQNEYGWGTVQLFDTREGTLLAEQSFPQTEYGGIHSVSDDCFAIQRGEDCVLCWIDWDYRAGDSREEDASAAADVRTVYDSGTSVSDATVYDAGGAAEEAPFRRGDVLLDTYRIESDPIHGGMGSVWRVRHQGWNVDLAMKRPQAGAFQSQRQKESFVQECESWISLGLHPNIVSCYYVREIEGTPTIFSEWMENGSLENRIRDGSLYQGKEKEVKKRLLDIAIQFARGLHYAHEAGLIHQDVKPDNLLLTDDWEARVADFGLAQARAQLTVLDAPDPSGGDPGMTRMAPSGGYTPAYCSMEQMDGKALTRRTDIYSWAVSVMEMYLGERPWTNGVVAGLNCEEYMAALRVSMHGRMQRLLSQCLAPDPEDRPHDFHAVEMALREVYHLVAGEEYPRPASQAARDTAGSLNNRALSFLDLGRLEDALALWDRALSMDNSSFCCHFNRAAALWKANRITGEELLRTVESREEDSDPWRQAMQAVRFAKPVTEQDLLAPAEKKLWAVKQPGEVLYSTEIRRQAEEDGVELAKEPFRDFQPIYTKKRDENGVYERSLDGRKTISFDPETEEYTVTDGTAVLRLSKEWGYNWQFVDAEGEWIIGHGSDLQLLSAETGHSLLTFHSERDWEGDVIYDNVATVSANGFIRIKNYHRTTDWIRLPPAKPQVDYLLSRVESFAQRREAMERLIRDYPVARMLFRAMEYEAAMHLLSPACEDGTLFYHEEALQLWEDLFPYCTPGRLVTVLQDPRPTRIDDLPFPEEPGTDWETNGASDGRTRITIEEHYTMRENYNNGVDVDFTYSASACDVASGKLYYAMDKLTADAQSDDKLLDYGLKVKLSGAFLWFTKESWGFVGVLGLGYPDEQRKRQLRLALPGLGGYFLRNTEKGLDIGGFFFEDEYSGLEPLWDRQRIFTRKNVYRLIYQYTGLRETPIQVPPDPPEEKPRVIPADIPPIRLDNPKVRPGPAIRIRVRASETPPPDTEERPAEGLGPDAEKEPAEKPNPDGGADPVGGPGPGEEKKPAEEPGPDGEKKKKPGLWARLFGKKK